MSAIKDNDLENMLKAIEEEHPGLLDSLEKEVKAMLEPFGEPDIVILPSHMSYKEKEIYCVLHYLKKGLSLEEAEKEAKLLLGVELIKD